MTVLTFTGPAATAAAHIITGTSLQNNWPRAIGPGGCADSYRIVIDDDWRWSSGEKWLIELLYALSLSGEDGRDGDFRAQTALAQVEDRCDSDTYARCVEAVAMLTAPADV